MARPGVRWLGRIAVIAITIIAALALPWALSWLWRWLRKQWEIWIVVAAIAADAVLVLLGCDMVVVVAAAAPVARLALKILARH